MPFATKATTCAHLEEVMICIFVINQTQVTPRILALMHMNFLKERIKIGWQEATTLKSLKLKSTQ